MTRISLALGVAIVVVFVGATALAAGCRSGRASHDGSAVARLFFTSAGKTCLVRSDGTGLRTLEFAVPYGVGEPMLNPDETIILLGEFEGRRMLVGFHPQPGNYQVYLPPGCDMVAGSRWQLSCPVCRERPCGSAVRPLARSG